VFAKLFPGNELIKSVAIFSGHEALTAMIMKKYIFRDTTPFCQVEVSIRFVSTYRLHLQVLRVIQAYCLLQAHLLFRFFFDHENGSKILLQNLG
jgi:hypothetical protein